MGAQRFATFIEVDAAVERDLPAFQLAHDLLERAEQLGLEGEALVHVYEGLSLADDQPIAIFRSLFPAARFPDLLKALETSRSVTSALAQGGVADYTRASTRLTAVLADVTQALHLHLKEGDPLLRSTGVNVDAKGVPVEYGRTWFAGDRVTLTFEG